MKTFVLSPFGHEVLSDSIRELCDNDLQSDRRVTLCAGETLDGEDTFYFLRTNGNPVLLTDDEEEAWHFVRSSGLSPTALIVAIGADAGAAISDSKEWAITTLGNIDALQSLLDTNAHEVEQTYYGFRARLATEAEEEGGGWLSKGEASREQAEYDLADYVRRRHQTAKPHVAASPGIH